ncbi:MAG: hypothetical protein DRJ41_01760 [Thermoprotei archaeon]|nr:MAG: hypothetical protein DRJ41_01760 [Thermoprotei archaeon]
MNLPKKRFQCYNCGQMIEVPQGIPKPPYCPKCGAPAFMIHRVNPGPPEGRRGWRGKGRGKWRQASL